MSHFYGNMQGSRGETTRCGDRNSGLGAHVRGWDMGVSTRVRATDNGDAATVYLTGGSNGSCGEVFLGNFARKDNGFEVRSGLLRYLIDAAERVAVNYVDMSTEANFTTSTPPSVVELRRIINILEGKG